MHTLPVILLAAAGVGFGHSVMPDHWLPLAVLSRTRRYRTGTVARLSLAAAIAHVLVSLLLGGVVILAGLQFRTTIAGHTGLVVGGILLAAGAVFLILDVRGRGHGHEHRHGHEHGHGHEHRQGHSHEHSGIERGAPEHSGHEHRGHEHRGHEHRGHEHRGHEDHEHAGYGGSGTAVLDRPMTATGARARGAPARGAQARGARGLATLLIPFGAAASPDLTILPVFLAASALGVGAAIGSLAVFTIVTVVTIVGLTIATALGARLLTAPWVDRGANLLTAGTLLLIGALVVSGLI